VKHLVSEVQWIVGLGLIPYAIAVLMPSWRWLLAVTLIIGGALAAIWIQDWVVRSDPGYRGATQNETGATANLGAFRNRAQSAQILDGAWELCEEPGWGGRCMRIESSVPDLQTIGLRGVGSARPIDPIR